MRAVIVLALVFGVACGNASPSAPITFHEGSGTAYIVAPRGDTVGLQPFDVATGHVQTPLGRGVISPDGQRLYTLLGSQLRAVNLATGATTSTIKVPDSLDFPAISGSMPAGLSQDGTRLVLESGSWRAGKARLWVGDLRSGTAQTVELDGQYEFDGIANDGSALYLLQWLPAQPGKYSVREYDLKQRTLLGYTLTDKTEGQASMGGSRMASVDDPHGTWQYTLYLGGPTGAFIHALRLMGDFPLAWCIELPKSNTMVAASWAIAMAPDGSRVYAYNAQLGQMAVLHPARDEDRPVLDQLQQVSPQRSGRLPFVIEAEAKEMGGGGRGVVARDGSRVYMPGMGAVDVVDARAERLVQSVLIAAGDAVSLALTRDGATVLALSGDSTVTEIDTRTLATRSFPLSLGLAFGIQGIR